MTENKRYWIRCDETKSYSVLENDNVIVYDLFKLDAILVCNKLNELHDEIKKLRTLNYVNKEAVRLNCIKTVKIGNNDVVDCSDIDWKHLYKLYGVMIDYYYDGDV